MRSIRIAAGLLAGIAVFLVVCELGLRLAGFNAPIWFGPDERLGWGMRPGVEGWYTKEGHAYVRVNQEGFRDVDHSVGKPSRTYRIAVIGDSAVEALQVDMKAAFWWQLQEKLRSCPALNGREVEVLAFGVSGYGTAQQYLLLQSTAMRYRPDAVLLAFAGNDVINNSPRLEDENERPFFVPTGDELALDDSFRKRSAFVSRSSALYEAYRSSSDWLRVVQLVQAARNGVQVWRQAGVAHAAPERKQVAGVEPTTKIELFAPPRDAALQEAWTVTERLAAQMNRYSARHGARFALLMLSHSAQVHPDAATRAALEQALGVPDLFYMERRMQALGQREGFPVIALAPELQKRAAAEKVYFHGFPNYRMGWGHWNEKGHQSAAELIAPRLCAEVQG
jgi:lysophospholipase L1-like esterase